MGYIKKEIARQFGREPLKNKNYGKIINEKHFNRICSLMDSKKIVYGGETDKAALKIAPTVMDNVTWDDDVMGEEIFGPVLPILTFKEIDDAIAAGMPEVIINGWSLDGETAYIQYLESDDMPDMVISAFITHKSYIFEIRLTNMDEQVTDIQKAEFKKLIKSINFKGE